MGGGQTLGCVDKPEGGQTRSGGQTCRGVDKVGTGTSGTGCLNRSPTVGACPFKECTKYLRAEQYHACFLLLEQVRGKYFVHSCASTHAHVR